MSMISGEERRIIGFTTTGKNGQILPEYHTVPAKGECDVLLRDGTMVHLRDMQYHCTNGPAIIYPDGSERWFINGNEIPMEKFRNDFNVKGIGEILDPITRQIAILDLLHT